MMSVGEQTDHAGNFSFDVNEQTDIAITPFRFDSLVAPKQWIEYIGYAADEANKLPRFDFVLKKGTKVHGKIVSPEDQKPIPDAYLHVRELKGPGELAVRDYFSERHIRADKDGHYTVYFPPGFYRATGIETKISKAFEIKNEEELQIDF